MREGCVSEHGRGSIHVTEHGGVAGCDGEETFKCSSAKHLPN